MTDSQSVSIANNVTDLEENQLSIQPLSQRSMFWRPAYLEQSAWLEHIPFAFWLTQAHRPRVMVELGTHYGVSYFAFCQAVNRLALSTRCFAVDMWKGDEHAGFYGEEVFQQVNAHNQAQYSGFSRLVRSNFDDALNYFEDGSIDLLHIDGLHTFEAVTHDFESWLPKLSNRGVVIMHDTNVRERNFGVFRLFSGLKSQYPYFEFVHGHGLGVIGTGAEQNDLLQRLLETSGNEQASQAVQEVFGRLGRACADSLYLVKSGERVKALGSQVGKQKKQLDELKSSLDKTKTELNHRSKELNDISARMHSQQEKNAVKRGQLTERANLFQEQREDMRTELAGLRERIDATEQKLSNKDDQLLTLNREAHDYNKELLDVRKQIVEKEHMSAELESAKTALTESDRRLSESQTEHERLAGLAQDKAKRLDAAQLSINRLKTEIAGLRDEAATQSEMHAEALERACADAKAESERNASLAKLVEDRDVELQEKEAELQAENKRVDKVEEDKINEIRKLKNEIEALREKAQKKSAEHEAAIKRAMEENSTLQHEKRVQAENIKERFAELANLTKLLEERDAQLDTRQKKLEKHEKTISESERQLSSVESQLKSVSRDLTEQKQRLAKSERDVHDRDRSLSILQSETTKQSRAQTALLEERNNEISVLTQLLEQRDFHLRLKDEAIRLEKGRAEVSKRYISWKATGPMSALNKRDARKREVDVKISAIKSSELFDAEWYRAAYPEVSEDGFEPAEHYFKFGASEGRDPGPKFSTRNYLEVHNDVAEAGVNPLLHYIEFGIMEGRVITPANGGSNV